MPLFKFPFRTIRARVAAAAAEIDKTMAEKRIVFGPGFVPPPRPVEATSVLLNPQTMMDITAAWGSLPTPMDPPIPFGVSDAPE